MDDCITQYDTNYKGYLFTLLLKPVASGPVIKSAEGDVMDWEASVTVINLNWKKTYNAVKESQKKKVK